MNAIEGKKLPRLGALKKGASALMNKIVRLAPSHHPSGADNAAGWPGPPRRRALLALAGILFSPLVWADQGRRPALMLANLYRAAIDLDAYWVSEKYDGVRGYWDGTRLLTRGGIEVQAPAWFTAGWPAHALDGELWAGHGRFETAVSTVRTQTPDDAAWREMRFMVFDLPQHPGVFNQRIPAIQAAVAKIDQAWVRAGVSEFLCSRRRGTFPKGWKNRSSYYAGVLVNRSA
jgi:hypothetical protein